MFQFTQAVQFLHAFTSTPRKCVELNADSCIYNGCMQRPSQSRSDASCGRSRAKAFMNPVAKVIRYSRLERKSPQYRPIADHEVTALAHSRSRDSHHRSVVRPMLLKPSQYRLACGQFSVRLLPGKPCFRRGSLFENREGKRKSKEQNRSSHSVPQTMVSLRLVPDLRGVTPHGVVTLHTP